METYEFTKQKIAQERRAWYGRASIVVLATAGAAAIGFAWPDSESLFGLLRVGFLAASGMLASIVLTR